MNIYKNTNKLGNPSFKAVSAESLCKICFNNTGTIIKASCGNPDEPVLVYCKDEADINCLKDAMYEMLVISQQCFIEMFNEIKCATQLALAKEVIALRSAELKNTAKIALESASILDTLL